MALLMQNLAYAEPCLYAESNRPSLDDYKTTGGGVAIAIKTIVRHSLLQSFKTSVIEALGIEICAVCAAVPKLWLSIILGLK